MEEKFDKLISLIEEQNKAWSVAYDKHTYRCT